MIILHYFITFIRILAINFSLFLQGEQKDKLRGLNNSSFLYLNIPVYECM